MRKSDKDAGTCRNRGTKSICTSCIIDKKRGCISNSGDKMHKEQRMSLAKTERRSFMKRKKACAALLCAAMTVSGFPLGGGIVSARQNVTQETDFDIYVSPQGSDSEGDGSEENPYATLDKAREAVRELTADGGSATVSVGEGKYFLEDPVVFGPEDSNVTYVGDNAVLTGAKPLENLEWENYEGEIQVASVEAGLGIDQLFIDGAQQTLARYPNYDADQVLQGSTNQADIKARSANWEDPSGGYIRALHSNRWGGNSYRITGKNDSALGLSYEWVGDNNRGSGMLASAIMVENIFEELDSPGEWYYDNEEGRLYVWPQEGMDLNNVTVEGAVTEELLHVEGEQDGDQVTNLVFDGLTLENTKRTMFTGTYIPLMRSDWCVVRSGALFIQDAEGVTFENGTIRNIGGNGIFLSGHSKGVTIDNNEIINIGSSGILAAGFPDSCREASFWEYTAPLEPETAEKYVHKTTIDDTTPGPAQEHYPREAVISNNHVRNVGIWEKQSSHVALSVAYKIQILHNTLHEGPRAGINIGDGTFGGHEVAYNDIFDVQRETDDHGMFNSWGRDRFWSLGGFDTGGNNGAAKEPYSELDVIDTITIHDNRMHFAGRVDGGTTFGIDLDDGSTNYEIYNNLCLNMGIKLREGFHRNVYNNIIVNGQFNLHCTFEDSYDTIERNIVIKGTPYSLAATSESRFAVSEDVIDNNWFYDFGMKTNYPSYWENLGYDENSVNADPMFADPSSNDYTVTNEAVMEMIGFENFPMDQFGKPGCEYQAPFYEKTEPDGNVDILEREEWLGATISALDDAIMSSTGAGGLDGVYMESVPEDSQAAEFGLQTGDVLKSVNGQEIGKKSNFIPMYDDIGAGTVVSLRIVRNQLTEELNFVKYDTQITIDDQDSAVVYHGSGWETSTPDHNPANAANCVEQTMTYHNMSDADRDEVYIEAAFSGSQIELISRTENNMGDYEIVITDSDGEIVQEAVCSAYRENKEDQVSLFTSEVFPEGDYTLTMKCVTGSYLILDAFRVTASPGEEIDQIVVEPVSVSADGVRVTELASGNTLDITVPVQNDGGADLHVTAAAVISGSNGALQTESVTKEEVAVTAGSEEEIKLTVDTPEGSEAKRLEILVYNTDDGKVYTHPRTIDGSSIVPYDVSVSDAAGDEIEYTYTAEERVLTVASGGLTPGVQALAEITTEDGAPAGIRQGAVEENGQVKYAFILPEGTEGSLAICIRDEKGIEKELTAEIKADENVMNKTVLQAAVDAAAEVIADPAQEEIYTKDSWMTFYNAYYTALKRLEDNTGTQADVLEKANALTEAQAGLTPIQTDGSYTPSRGNMGELFQILRNDGTVDGGNKDSGGGDQWQARDAQVDTTFKGAYAEFKGCFTSFMIDGANKYDSADFRVVITNDATGEVVSDEEITQSRNQSGTVRIYEKTGLSGEAVTIRVYQNDDVSTRYLELKGITYTVSDPEAQKVPDLTGIEVTRLPDVTEYEVGYEGGISLLGGEITETYSDGSTNVIPMNSSMYADGFDTSEAGTKTVTVSHRGLTAQFELTVKENPEEPSQPVSKKNLEYFLNEAKGYVEDGTVGGLVESIQKMFADAIAKGEAVMADEDATREEVLDAAKDLMMAIHALDMKAADKTDLEMALELAEMIDLSKYVEAGQAEFLEAKEAAEGELSDGDAMQAETDEAWNRLVEAMNALRLKADKSVLEDLISQTEDLDLTGYTEESVSVFRAALAAANDILADENLSVDDQAKVDEAAAALQAAADGLEKAQGGEAENPGGSNTGDAQKPGGSQSGNVGQTTGGNADGQENQKSSAAAGAVKTGDSTPMMAAVILLAAATGAVLFVTRKRTGR